MAAALRPATLLAAGALLFVVAFQLWVSPTNPPGFHHDEAAFALNAYTLGHSLRDQTGGLLPIAFPSYGNYPSAFFSYVLAIPELVLGPKNEVVRGTAAAFGVGALLLLGILAYRRAGAWIAVAAVTAAGLEPWLFQVGRVAYDTSMFPFFVLLVLLAVDGWTRSDRPLPWRAAGVAVALALMTYGYPAGRLLGPLFAAALAVFLRRPARRAVIGVWIGYAACLIPLGLYRLRHPNGLTARYHDTTFLTPGMSVWTIVHRAAWNYLRDMSPLHWVTAGDPKPYLDVSNAAELLWAFLFLVALGVYEILRNRRGDRFWIYVLAAYLLSGLPAALTVDRHDTTRLSAMPACMAVLAIPGLQLIWRSRSAVRAGALAALGILLVVQWGLFVHDYTTNGPNRVDAFDAGVGALVARGLAGGRTIYVDHDDPYALTYGQWYAVSHGLPRSRVVRLPDGGIPPTGSMVLGRTQSCDYVCPQLAAADSFWLARAAGPKPAG